jgi:predicted nuclease of predicted toxin-antitoxin system
VKRFLIDENLPRNLLAIVGPASVHATDIGERKSDIQLWTYAKEHGFVILTKDADFFNQLAVEGAPPKVVWIRTGNLRRGELEALIARNWPRVHSALDGADLIEIHTNRIETLTFDSRKA